MPATVVRKVRGLSTSSDPLFESARFMSPKFEFRSLDVFCDLETIIDLYNGRDMITISTLPGTPAFLSRLRSKSLSRFSAPNADGRTELGPDPRIGAPFKCELSTVQQRGFAFEAAITQKETGLPPQTRHFRVIRYDFGQIALAIRFEVDAWEPVADRALHSDSGSHNNRYDVSDHTAKKDRGTERKVILAGYVVDASETVEIKTSKDDIRERFKGYLSDQYLAQAWFSRKSKLCLGMYNSNHDFRVETRNMSEGFALWERKHRSRLRWLHNFLRRVTTEVSKSSSKHCVAVPLNRSPGVEGRRWELYEVESGGLRFSDHMDFLARMAEYDSQSDQACSKGDRSSFPLELKDLCRPAVSVG